MKRLVITDESEAAIVHIYRALIAYGNERNRLDPTLEEDRDEGDLYVEIGPDGSGALRFHPDDPGPRLTICSWPDAPAGAEAIEAERRGLAESRIEREQESKRIREGRFNARARAEAAK